MANLKPYVLDSIISTTNVDNWRAQREDYQPAFSINHSLKKLFPFQIIVQKKALINYGNLVKMVVRKLI